MSTLQSGIIPNDSITNQLTHLYHIFCEAVGDDKEVRVVFYDISKAFDRVWHKGLMHKLESIGCRGILLLWFKTIYRTVNKGFLLLLLLGPPRFKCWFSFAPVFQWCCSTPQESPGVGHNTLFLSIAHLCFIIVFICDLFVPREDLLMCLQTFTRTEQLYLLSHDRSRGRGWDPVKPV